MIIKTMIQTLLPEKPLTRLGQTKWLRNVVLLFEEPRWSFLISVIFYSFVAQLHQPIWIQTDVSYYNYLADALLHGQLFLRIIPSYLHDVVLFHNRIYLYWPPMPAILLMPLVALFGVEFSDVIFSSFIGGLNVALVALLLRQASLRGLARLSRLRRGILVFFFAFGTVHATLPSFGQVWFTGSLVGFSFVALGYLSAIKLHGWKAFFVTGTMFACAAMTRNHLLFAIIWPLYYLWFKHWSLKISRLILYALLIFIPILLAISSLGYYNWVRFGSVTDVGLDYHLMHPFFSEDYQKYGPFHFHYLPTNFYYQYISYPLPIRDDSSMGGSLFLLSPPFIAVFGIGLKKYRKLSNAALLASIIIVNIPILLLMGTGWVQWGPRYTLDFTVPLLLLTAIGIREWKLKTIGISTLFSVVHYMCGIRAYFFWW